MRFTFHAGRKSMTRSSVSGAMKKSLNRNHEAFRARLDHDPSGVSGLSNFEAEFLAFSARESFGSTGKTTWSTQDEFEMRRQIQSYTLLIRFTTFHNTIQNEQQNLVQHTPNNCNHMTFFFVHILNIDDHALDRRKQHEKETRWILVQVIVHDNPRSTTKRVRRETEMIQSNHWYNNNKTEK